jgi:LuxR family glucitol operon transcriptional activator
MHRLPLPTYSQLFGVETHLEKVRQYLGHRYQHQIISIQGIGGIGKTALADYVVREFILQATALSDLIWISAKQEFLTETGIEKHKTRISLESLFDEMGQKLELSQVLRLPLAQKVEKIATLLRTEPYLVVIDNLETVEDFQGLVPWLEKLATPTKFLLTSREAVSSLTTVTSIQLTELDETASLALIQHTAVEKEVGDFDFQRVYELVGGNPLAIILSVSLMKYLPPIKVLEGIQLGTTDDIYRYVYWKSWSALNDDGRKLLLAFERAGDRVIWDWLLKTSELSVPSLQSSLRDLIALSLVQPERIPDHEHIYSIHRLTSSFLRAEVLGWK